MSTSLARTMWMDNAVKALTILFASKGHEVPANTRVGIGWPKGGGTGHTIGQCFFSIGSADGHHEIFVSPELGNPEADQEATHQYMIDGVNLEPEISTAVRILDVLAHELGHAICGKDAGHRKPFKETVESVGLTGPMKATTAGPEFLKWACQTLLDIGPFPTGRLHPVLRKKQSTRMLKCECGTCGYLVRTAQKWITEAGAPYCAEVEHGQMEVAL